MDYQCLGCGFQFNGWRNYCPECGFGVIATISIKKWQEEMKQIRESRKNAYASMRKMQKTTKGGEKRG